MITESLRHCRGIGPARLTQLHALGVRSWEDVVARVDRLPAACREELFVESRRCLAALEADDIAYFVAHLAPGDKWRILTRYIGQTTFFDIETTGLSHDAPITVIACWHRGELLTFAEHENLDGFLDLLDDVTLLVSFNGSSFDVPRLLDTFHIPELPCPHLDLRWICHHRGWKGPLKEITEALGIQRPPDLVDGDGAWAAHLWNRWIIDDDRTSRQQLLRYCAADVLLLLMLGHYFAGSSLSGFAHYWSLLPVSLPPSLPADASRRRQRRLFASLLKTPATRVGD